ncbi:MAG: biotin transporter BioY [Alphaproteobacteria bacterium]|nr:MAG: biotin transporter BioY [Alphaproteobacteria bacterium]
MSFTMSDKVLAEELWPAEGAALWVKRALLVVAGVALLALSAKIKVPLWPSPVPITLGTFAVLTIGAAYGPRLGLATILGYMIVGALGWDVFANSTAEKNGLEYMMGGTGGYLVGYVLATMALGMAARAGWDRSVWKMALAMLIGNALIYVPGILWLAHLYTWEKPILEWGLYPFLVGDALKLALAALLVPSLWKLIGSARA